jgi:hypothetical protein
MKGVPHFSICQLFWNEKLPWNIYLHIGKLTTTKMNEKSKQKHKWETTNDSFKFMLQIKMMIVLQQQVLVCGTYL